MRLMFATAFAAIAVACSPAAPAGPTAEEIAKASADLTAYLDAEYEEGLAMSPMRLTMLGRKEQQDKLDDFSDAATEKELAWMRESVAEMKAKFDPAKLDEESKTSFDMWALSLDQSEKADKFRRHGYVFIRDSIPTYLPNFMINFHEVAEKADMEAYIARLQAFGPAIDQVIEQSKLAAAEGIRPPLFSFQQVIGEARNVITGAPFSAGGDSPLLVDVKAKTKKLLDEGKITADEAKAFGTQASEAMIGVIEPVYERVIAWLETDKANASSQSQGVGALKDGAAYYNTMLELMTTTAMTADEIHELGLKEVARLRSEMEAIREKVGFKGDLASFFEFMRKDKQFYVPNTDEGRAAYLAKADEYVSGARAKLPEYFGILPKAPLVVKRVEAFREQPGGAAHYYGPTPDGKQPGIFYAHLIDMSAVSLWALESLAYHEGVPGHHMQIAIQNELTDIPVFRTQYGYGAFAEGWGLYAEDLGRTMGGFTDPYNDFGRLSSELWRAVRLVLDTGLHAKGWTEDEAVAWAMANSARPESSIKSEVQRYLLNPAQATTYKIGMIAIQKLRDEARTELGDKFDWKAFHDTVITGGSLPLPVLETRVRTWIAKVKAG